VAAAWPGRPNCPWPPCTTEDAAVEPAPPKAVGWGLLNCPGCIMALGGWVSTGGAPPALNLMELPAGLGLTAGDAPGAPCPKRFHAEPATLASSDMLAVGPPVMTLRGMRGMPGPIPPLLGSICCCGGGCVSGDCGW
jgi:hypothetical protein